MCSPSRKPEKRDIILTASFCVEQEKGQHKTDKIPMGPSRGYVVQKEGSRKLRYDGVAACYENGQTRPEDVRRRKTTVSWPAVAKITTQYQAGEKKAEIEDTTGLQPMYENEAS